MRLRLRLVSWKVTCRRGQKRAGAREQGGDVAGEGMHLCLPREVACEPRGYVIAGV